MNKGVDVSKHNGSINWDHVTADFAILRAGYGTHISQKDLKFENNYLGCKSNSIPVGVYWYSYATTEAEAKKEANVCLEVIKNKTFEMPIFYDVEESKQFKLGKSKVSKIIRAFLETVEKAGYFVGLYMSRSPFQTYVEDDIKKKYAIWLAEYNSKLNYSGPVGIWQYSSTGKMNGINGNVDMNKCFVDYPKIIKNAKLNGFGKNKKTVEQIAKEVIAGKWGNGEDRKKRLISAGYNYNAVQKKVNELI